MTGGGDLDENRTAHAAEPSETAPGGVAEDNGEAGGAWLTRNVKVLCGVSFLQDTASELLYPILPIFLTVVLGAPAAAVGIVEGVAEGIAALTKLAAGRVADSRARRPLIALGYGLAAAGKLLIAAASVWPLVLAGRGVDRVGKGLRGAPRDALLVQGVRPGRRGAVLGLHRAVDTAGAVAGPLLGLALYTVLSHHIRPMLWIAVIPAIASVALVAAVRERPSPPAPAAAASLQAMTSEGTETPEGTGTGRGRGAGGWRALPFRYWRLLAVLTVFSAINFPDALLLLRAHQVGLSTIAVIAVYALYNAVYAALSYPAGSLSDRLPRRLVYGAGLVFFAAGYLGLAFAHTTIAVLVVFAVYGGFNACTDGVGKAWVSSLVPAHLQGTAQGLFQGAGGAAVLIAGIWAGLAWNTGPHPSGTLALLISGTVAAAFALALLLTPRRFTSPASRP